MKMWKLKTCEDVKLKNPVFLEGLPGIGNVGKIIVDYILEKSVESKTICSFFSYDLPNTVFVNQDNLVNLPKIELKYAKLHEKDFLFLVGDVQPNDSKSSYLFSEKVLDKVQELGCKEIITLGGIGLGEPPQEIKVYCTGNNKDFINKFVSKGAKDNIYGVVGPILGVTGILLGLSKERDIKAAALLIETYNHPMHLGVKEAKQGLELLNSVYGMNICCEELDKEIESTTEDSSSNKKNIKDVNYIG